MGGNVFDGTSDFDHANIDEILKTVNTSLDGTGIEAIPVGSAATPTPGKRSGDLDVIVDQQAVMDYFDVTTPKDAKKMLADYIRAKGFNVAQSGVNVHVQAPVNGSSAQVDIMVVSNAPQIAKFHTHSIPKDSPYKGLHKQLAMYHLAKMRNHFWSAWQGLYNLNELGKKNELVSTDLDEIAKILLGNNANANDLGSYETIAAKLNPQDTKDLQSRLDQDANWNKVREDADLLRIKELARL